MVLTTGTKEDVRDATKTELSNKFLYCGVGLGDTTPTEGDTQLESETFRSARIDVDTTTFDDEITVTGEVDFGEANGVTLKEVGWFDSASAGNMKSRDVFLTEIVKTSDISVILPKKMTVTVIEV